MKYKINEKCPISEKVTFASDVYLTSDWLYSHLFQIAGVKTQNKGCTSVVALLNCTDSKWTHILTKYVFDLLNYTLRSCAILAPCWETSWLTHLRETKKEKNTHTTITTRFFITYPQGKKGSTAGWKNSFSLLKMTLSSTSNTWILSDTK